MITRYSTTNRSRHTLEIFYTSEECEFYSPSSSNMLHGDDLGDTIEMLSPELKSTSILTIGRHPNMSKYVHSHSVVHVITVKFREHRSIDAALDFAWQTNSNVDLSKREFHLTVSNNVEYEIDCLALFGEFESVSITLSLHSLRYLEELERIIKRYKVLEYE